MTKYQVFADFIKRIDEIKDIDDKRRFAAQYLFRHGLDTANPDNTLANVAYKAFDSPSHAMFGDLAAIEKAGNEYLEHKFPGWTKDMPLPSKETINRLDKTSNAVRAMSC